MEPGHEDREYAFDKVETAIKVKPQWSPVMKTGNTGPDECTDDWPCVASMEPGHEDREYVWLWVS